MFEPKSMIVVLGTCSLMLGAAAANAQLDVDSLSRAAGGVGAAGRAPGDIAAGAGVGVGAQVDATTRGLHDAEIGVHVQSQLTQQLATPGVRADVHNGVATLNGTVASEADKQKAEQIARRVEGVTRVHNALIVAEVPAHGASVGGELEQQTRVASPATDAAITQRLRADTRLAERDIDVRTRNDVVTLTGEVTSVAEKEAAGRIAAEAAAGVEVRNRLAVRAQD